VASQLRERRSADADDRRQSISLFDAIVVPNSLTPSQIRVVGTPRLHERAVGLNDPVVVNLTFGSGAASVQSGPVATDALTGAFSVQIPIPAGTVVQYDDVIAADAWCSTDPNCKAPTLRSRLDCPQCARATVSVISAGTCAGTPPKQPITLGAPPRSPHLGVSRHSQRLEGALTSVARLPRTGKNRHLTVRAPECSMTRAAAADSPSHRTVSVPIVDGSLQCFR
jgi:hypothetical protein